MPRIASRVVDGTRRTTLESPLGSLTLLATDGSLVAVLWDQDLEHPDVRRAVAARDDGRDEPLLAEACRQLRRYFEGRLVRFDLPLELRGTPFQVRAWRALLEVGHGETVSYREQALRLGGARLARPVGGANARNPLSIVVPCHRVVGSDGSLTGYGGGLERKRALLDLERRVARADLPGRGRRAAPERARPTRQHGALPEKREASSA